MLKNVKFSYGNVRFHQKYARPEIYVVSYIKQQRWTLFACAVASIVLSFDFYLYVNKYFSIYLHYVQYEAVRINIFVLHSLLISKWYFDLYFKQTDK